MEPSVPKTILVVDDEIHIVNVVAMKFRHAGYEVMTARDPSEAFEIAQEKIPDLIITDHQMPGGSGIDLAKKLKSTPTTVAIPIILLTAYDFSIVREELGDCNVCEIMPKPFSPRELVNRSAEILGSTVT